MKRSSSESHNARINGRVVSEFGTANEVLKVLLWGQEIGRLAWHDARKTSFFMYNPEFLKGTLDIAPLAASIHNPLSTRAIFGEAERIYQKLPSFIADSLPDAWGNMLFEQWRRDNRLTERNVTSIEKLAFIGKRGMGALEFVPEIKRGSMTGQIDIKALADLAEKIAMERENRLSSESHNARINGRVVKEEDVVNVRILPDESLTLQSLIDDHNKNFTFIMDRQGTWRLSPAYDMTYIFDTGGYLPNKDHCLMIGGKLQGITRDDAIQFARDNGIRRPDAIIRDVVASLKQFRSIATKYSVSEQWTGRVEITIIDHLKAWGEWEEDSSMPELNINGHSVSNIRMEQAYKGNYHLLAEIDGKERKFVIGKNKEEFALIEKTGIANLTPDQLQAMAEKYFFS